MKKIYFIIALIAGTSFSSCEDFLNQVPEHELVQENAVIDYNSAKNIVNGMYSNYASSKNMGGYIYGNLHMQAGIYKTGGNLETSRSLTPLIAALAAFIQMYRSFHILKVYVVDSSVLWL